MSDIVRAYREHYQTIRKVIARYVKRAEDVDDLAQEAFLKAYMAEFNEEIAKPRAYLIQVARNLAVDEMRRRIKKPTDPLEDFEESIVLLDERSGRAEERLDAQRKLAIIAGALASLPPECRTAFLMRKMDGLRVKEVARRLDLSVSAVEKRVARSLVLINAWLIQQGHDPAEFGAALAKARYADKFRRHGEAGES